MAERDAAVAEKVKVLDETKEHSANENGMRKQLVDEVVKLQTELAVTKSELEAMRDELKVQESSIDHAKFLAEINGQMKDVEMKQKMANSLNTKLNVMMKHIAESKVKQIGKEFFTAQ